MNDYANVLRRFDRLKPCRRAQTWCARCPVHNDRFPSLLVWVGRKGNLLARCLAQNCRWDAIVKAIGTEAKDWFNNEDQFKPRWKVGQLEQLPPPSKFYDYKDETGKLVYQVLRFDLPEHPWKTFRQRQPDGKGRWINSLDGVEKIPYRLPELLADPKQPVVVVEGEKDVESLNALGLVATTNAGGAGKWTPEMGRYLRGRRVAIIPDRDGPGQAHALCVAASLLYWSAASIRIVHLPSLAEGGDVSDWLADFPPTATNQQKREQLCKLIRLAPEWTCHIPTSDARAA